MTKGATFSLLLHVFVVLVAFFGLPVLAKPDPVLEKPLLVDIVTIAKVTNLPPPTPKVEPKPEPKIVEPEPPKPEPPKPEPPKVVETPPPPPPPPPPPQKVVEQPKPEPPKPEPPKPQPPKPAEVKPEPAPKIAEPKPEPKPEPPKVEPPKPEPPKPVAKVEPPKPAPPKPEPPKPQPKRDDTFDRLLKDLANKKPATEPPKEEAKKPEPPKPQPQQQAALPPTPNRSPPPRPMTEGQLSLSELDAIRSQIAQCWNVPAGARDARNLVVELQVDMNPDATVRNVRVVDESRMTSDAFFRAAAESALRAVRNPRCNPLRLPAEKFDTWKSFILNFNPKEML